jgi:hypothetical protein
MTIAIKWLLFMNYPFPGTGCRGSLSTTIQNENPVPGQPHNHAPSNTSIKYAKTRNALKTWQPTPETNPARSLPRLCPSVTTMSKPCCPVKKTPSAQFDTSVQLLQSQPPMQMSDYLKSTQQQPTVPPIRQRPECSKQNVSLLVSLCCWLPGLSWHFWFLST